MTDFPASHADLLDGHFATFSTITPTGHPQTTEIVFLHDGRQRRRSVRLAALSSIG
jgi:hypothetical protein